MRPNRDVRFSADKSPYKTHVAAWWSTTTIRYRSPAAVRSTLSMQSRSRSTRSLVGITISTSPPSSGQSTRNWLNPSPAATVAARPSRPKCRLIAPCVAAIT